MNAGEGVYEHFLRTIRTHGVRKGDRTGTGTTSLFGHQMRFDLSKAFPLITTKKIHTKSVVGELIWMLRGETNVKWLNDRGITIWDEWADENGDLGPVYGQQWRDFGAWSDTPHPTDQITDVIEQIKSNPDSRRHIVTAWNPGELQYQALPPCHMMFQFYVVNGRLSCQLYQRSADAFLGVPFNIASYALLTHIIAKQCNLEVGEFIWTGGDCHIYDNHRDQVNELLRREVRPFPILSMRFRPHFAEHEIEDFTFLDYNPHPAIKADVAV